ncbi:MAG: tetratricopeptide repeat protein [Verrucomicrobiota bacterium]
MASAFVLFSTECVLGEGDIVGDVARVLNEAEGFFQEANETALTDPGKAGEYYEKAAMRFDYVAREGMSGRGYALGNLGNTYFLGGDLGRAILSYRKALEILPNNAQLRASLSHAREQRVDVFEFSERPPWVEWLFFWHYKLNHGERVAVFLCAWMVIWALAFWRLFSGTKNAEAWRQGTGVCLVVCVLVGTSIWWHEGRGGDERGAVILQDEVEARKGDGFIYEPAFKSTLHSGTELDIVEERGDWVRGQFGNGEKAWVPREVIGLVSDDA